MKCRVGIGFDIHRLVIERKLKLGGVEIPYPKGLGGHSDGDVLLHAVTDALLGASGLGNIGERFPDTDARYEGIDSGVLLAEAAALVREKGFQIGNIDSNVLAEHPKLLPYLSSMRRSIARILELPSGAVAVKAKTMERLGPIGRNEAIAAEAVATIYVP